MSQESDILIKLKENYSLFAYGWSRSINPNYEEIIEDTYQLLLELKEINPTLAHQQAEWLIDVAKGWTITKEYEKAYEKWIELMPLFKRI